MTDLAIFYEDNSIIECRNDDQVDVTITFKVSRQYLNAPSHGVQAIVQRDSYCGRHVLRGQDHYYAMPEGLIHAADNLIPFLDKYLPGIIKYGVCLDDKYWAQVMHDVKHYKGISRDGPRKPRPDVDV